MSRVINPVLFSSYFRIQPHKLADSGLIDPFVNVDIPLFIDPVLLEKSRNDSIRISALRRFRSHFENLVRLLQISKMENDAAWKAAGKLLSLREPPENGLGFGGQSRHGSSRPTQLRESILRTLKEIVELGATDPEMISLMGFFEDNVGPDTISDLTTNTIYKDLSQITNSFCSLHNIPTFDFADCDEYKLPRYIDQRGRARPIVLVPQDIVRELPIARDWGDIERAAMENSKIRDSVNRFLGSIVRPTVAERKNALRKAALCSAEDFNYFLESIKENADHYDPNVDALGYYKLKEILSAHLFDFMLVKNYELGKGSSEILRLVIDSIGCFKHHVENGNLWEAFWIDDKPKKERASQLIYFAIADCFCKANNVDISPEANMGGGPVDFKFSIGYNARVLVEIKRSGGNVVHGYEKQLEFYRSAAQTDYAVFVVVNYGDIGNKMTAIERIRQARLNKGERASEVIVIDANRKLSASKRH